MKLDAGADKIGLLLHHSATHFLLLVAN